MPIDIRVRFHCWTYIQRCLVAGVSSLVAMTCVITKLVRYDIRYLRTNLSFVLCYDAGEHSLLRSVYTNLIVLAFVELTLKLCHLTCVRDIRSRVWFWIWSVTIFAPLSSKYLLLQHWKLIHFSCGAQTLSLRQHCDGFDMCHYLSVCQIQVPFCFFSSILWFWLS